MAYKFNPLTGKFDISGISAADIKSLNNNETVTGLTLAADSLITVASTQFTSRLARKPMVIVVYDSAGEDLGFMPYAEANGDYFDIKIYNPGAEITGATLKVF